MAVDRLGVGFIGSGFVTRFHIQAWLGVRDADVLGVYSPNREHAAATASLARELRVGNAQAFNSIEEMIAAPDIDCFGFVDQIICACRICRASVTHSSLEKGN